MGVVALASRMRVVQGMRVCIVLILVSMIGCSSQRAKTQELLDLAFISIGGSAIELQSPGDNAAVGLNPTFVWSPRTGAVLYRLEISTTNDFSQLVLDKKIAGTSYTVVNSDLSGVSSLDSIGYYWRVSVSPNNQLQSRVFTMQVVGVTATSGGNFYVDASFDPSLTKTSYGNKSAPYRSINEGVISANTARNSNPAIQVNVLVSKGTYVELVQILPNISLRGGYDSTNGWSRNIAQNVSRIQGPSDRAVNCATSISTTYMNTTVIEGMSITNSTVIGPSYGLFLYQCSIKITNNTITAFSSSNTTGTTQAYGIYNGFSSGIYSANTITAYARSAQAYGIFNQVNSAVTGNNVTIANNVIYASSGYSTGGVASAYGLYSQFFTLSANTVSNNTIIMSGRNECVGVYGLYNSIVTNNLIVPLGTINGRVNVSEQGGAGNADTPRSFENNLMWDGYATFTTGYNLYADGVVFTCTTQNLTCRNSIATIEALTDWVGGTDKARGNILFPQGVTGTLFVNVPKAVEFANAAGTTTQMNFSSNSGQAVNDYVEINRDGIPRQITGLPANAITFTPALSANSTTGSEVRNWGANTGAAACFSTSPGSVCAALNIDAHLAQNSLSVANWNNIRYGGKDTSGNNCGAPGGGPGVGAGGESCGNVTTDRDGVARTTANAGLATNTNNGGVPGGFSIGAYESD